MKYLLSTGKLTDRVEEYAIDLFRLYLSIYPGDIPGNSSIGFDFNLIGVKKDDLEGELTTRLNSLIRTLSSRFSNSIEITLDSIEIFDYSKAYVSLTINQTESDTVIINLSNNQIE